MNVLVFNSGSSSLKFQLIDTKTKKVIIKGTIDRIGEKVDWNTAAQEVFKRLEDAKVRIDAIGHRVVHGGEYFRKSTIVTDENLKKLAEISNLAPLHNPANIKGIEACRAVMPEIPNVMVFDTAFHSEMPASAYLYGLPLEDFKKHGIRRYGFHGTSHNYVSEKCAEMYGKPRKSLRIITCHLGTGCSICAVDKGKSVETSMGLTPLEGLVMGTRCGDIDPAALSYLSKAHNFTLEQTVNYLNKECGLKGLAGIGTSDMRDVLAAIKSGNEDAKIAMDVFCHRITKYIGAYAAIMGGVDAIAWTGGVGNNVPVLRGYAAKKLAFIGASIDGAKNKKYMDNFLTGEITKSGASVRTFVIKTEEELAIAAETAALLK